MFLILLLTHTIILIKYLIYSLYDPDLNRNATNYIDNHKYRDATEIILHFINVKYQNILTNRNGNKLARAMVAYLWGEL